MGWAGSGEGGGSAGSLGHGEVCGSPREEDPARWSDRGLKTSGARFIPGGKGEGRGPDVWGHAPTHAYKRRPVFLVCLEAPADSRDLDPLFEMAWESIHKKLRAQLRLSPKYRPWTEQGEKKLAFVPQSPRMREAIDLAWPSRLVGSRPLPFFIDLSQCASRRRWGQMLPCLTTSSVFYSYEDDRVLSKEAHLILQGFPVDDLVLTGLTPSNVGDLAGEAMSLPCLATILIAVVLNPAASWWNKA